MQTCEIHNGELMCFGSGSWDFPDARWGWDNSLYRRYAFNYSTSVNGDRYDEPYREWFDFLGAYSSKSREASACGLNPVNGGPGINAQASGNPGELRPGAGGSGKGYFGSRRDGGRTHTGADISAQVGTSIVAFAPGRISAVSGSSTSSSGYGLMITVDHGGGYTSRYAHLSDFLGLKAGMSAGSSSYAGTIGLSGQSGNANGQAPTEAHLHFEIRKSGVPIDPVQFLNDPCPKGFKEYESPRPHY